MREEAFLAARRHLADDARQLDWASLQLYARSADGSETQLAAAASLEHLRTPQIREQLSQFRTLFSGARKQIALLGRYKAFHDVLQELEVSFDAIERDKKRLLASPEAWDELRDPLEDLLQLLDKTLRTLGEDRLRDEFDMSRRRLTDAAAVLGAAMAGEPKKLEACLLHVRRVLGLDLSSANNRLLATARELGLGAVVAAARLPITPAPVAAARPLTTHDLFPFAATAGTSLPTALSDEKLEEAIVHVLLGERGAKAIAPEYGIDRAELERLAGLYREAGRAAIHRDRKPRR